MLEHVVAAIQSVFLHCGERAYSNEVVCTSLKDKQACYYFSIVVHACMHMILIGFHANACTFG
jgi:hypothetical protein